MAIVEDKGWQTLFQNWIKWFSVQPLISVWAERKTGSGAKPTWSWRLFAFTQPKELANLSKNLF